MCIFVKNTKTMKRLPIFITALALVSSVAVAEELKLREDNISQIVKAMTLEEKAHLVVGADMKKIAATVVMDCTHSVQRPGAAGGKTGGNREFVPAMAQAAKAFGANGFFFEVHPDPDKGMSDAANMLELEKLEAVVKSLI